MPLARGGCPVARRGADAAFSSVAWIAGIAGFAIPAGIVGYVVARGAGVMSWEFLTASPGGARLGTAGGIGPAIVGSFGLAGVGLVVALPLGLGGALYLAEYGGGRRWTRAARVAVEWLAAVPALVYGLFGYALLVVSLSLGISLAAGGLTLGIVMFPILLVGSHEALEAAGRETREVALALGVSRLYAARRVVLRRAWPGIIAATVLAAGHAVGSAAPVLHTASVAYARGGLSLEHPVMTLPTHLYYLVSEATSFDHAYGTALVLVGGLLATNLAAAALKRLVRG